MKILFTPITSSSIAHVVRSLAIAEELKKRGHKIFFTSDKNKKAFIEEQGFEVVSAYDVVNLNDPEDQSVNFFKSKQELIINWFKSEIEAVKITDADLIITASGLLGPHTHYATGKPIISIMDSQYLDSSSGLMGLSMATNRLDHQILLSIMKPIFNRKFIKLYLSEIMEVYRKLGLPDNKETRADLYRPMKFLIPSDHILEPTFSGDEDIDYVGPLFWNGFEEMETDLTDDFIQNFKGKHHLVYLTFGGSIFEKRIYEKVLSGLSAPSIKVIVCLGPNWDRSEFPEDNESVLYRKFVPGMRLSRHADVVVHTGSQGAVSQALYYGKPQVAIPTVMDQAFFANRLEELGCGINVNKVPIHKFSKRESFSKLHRNISGKIIAAVEKLINDGSYRANAKKHSLVIRNYPEPSIRSADLIEQYMNVRSNL